MEIVIRRAFFHFMVAATIFTAASTTAVADAPLLRAKEPIPDEYIVVLKDSAVRGTSVAAIGTDMALRHSGVVLAVMSHAINAVGLHCSATAAEALTHDPRVAHIEENAVGHLSYNIDTQPGRAIWHLNRMIQSPPLPPNPDHTTYMWTFDGGANTSYNPSWSPVAIYIVDTGVNVQHTEFSNGNYEAGVDKYPTGDGTQTNPCGGVGNFYNGGHGTAVASIAAGRTVGVARGATIVPVKIAACHRNYGGALKESVSSMLATCYAMDWIYTDMVAHPRRRAVVNFSIWFTTAQSDCNIGDCVPAFNYNVRQLLLAGAVVVASANNQNENHCVDQTPAHMGYNGIYDEGLPTSVNVITVGGTNISDQRYTCATCPPGQDPGSNYGRCVDLWAPAHIVRAAHVATLSSYRDDQYWVDQLNAQDLYDPQTVESVTSGTSFSAPLVAGIAARVLQQWPLMTVREVYNYIINQSTPLYVDLNQDGDPWNDRVVGWPYLW